MIAMTHNDAAGDYFGSMSALLEDAENSASEKFT